MKHSIFLLLVGGAALVSSCKEEEGPIQFPVANYAGFIYTSTNATTGNGIIVLGRKSDGSITELPGSPYLTGAAGDVADGDFDTQWALRFVGDYLLAVNAGANPVNSSISVFKVNRTNGSLKQVDQNPITPAMDNTDSHGIRATSIANTTSGGKTWIVIGNQHSTAAYIMNPPQSISPIIASALRNLAVFTLDPATGILAFDRVGPTYDSGEYGGPVTVEFNPAGTKLLTTTVGVPHIITPDVDLTVQQPGRLYIYDFSGGAITQTGMYEEAGIAGNTGASWSPNGRYVYVSNANLHSSKEDQSVTVHDGTTAAKVQNFPTAGRNDEVCWTLISLDHTKLYAASFLENVVSVFDIGADGRLTQSLTPNFFPRRNAPPDDTKDLYEAPGYLYVLGALNTHAIATFRTSANGALTEVPGSPYYIPSSVGKTGTEQEFLGLTGFEK